MFKSLHLSFFFFALLFMGSLTAEQTLSMIKPDAVAENHVGEIIERFEKNGLRIAAIKMIKLTSQQAQEFYAEHSERPFYPDLIQHMTSGPIVALVLDGDEAIRRNRDLMGPTDPKKANQGTLRADFAKSVTANAVHGSDSSTSAKREIAFFFTPEEIY
jgi:nucleoside-diphosphate kinase